jgi:type I restriction enzyme S subunit
MATSAQAWKTAKIEDLSNFITVGFVGSMSSLFVDEGVPLIRGQNILPYRLDMTNLKYISADTHQKWKKSALQPRDVVIVRVGYPGTACVIPDGIGDLNAASLVIVRPNPGLLDSDFLCYVLNSPWGKGLIQGRLVGAAQQVFNTHTAADLDIPAPPLPIQRRIASILSAYDELIENSQRRIKILESMARALYREWFVHFRFPGHESVPRVPSPLGEIPQGWEVKKFSELASYVNGYPFKPAQLGTEGKPIIKIKELKAGIVADTPRNLGDDIPEKYHISNGAVLFSWSADLDTYLWMGGDGLLNQHLFTVLPANGLSHAFCLHSLKEAMPRFRALSLGATMHHIKRSALDQVFTVVAPATTRRRFDLLVEPIHTQLITLTRQVQNLRRTRDLLLPRLLSGQIDVEAIAS